MIRIELTIREGSAPDPNPYVQTALARFCALGVLVTHSSTLALREISGGDTKAYTVCVDFASTGAPTETSPETLARVEAALKTLARDAGCAGLRFRLSVGSGENDPTGVPPNGRVGDGTPAKVGC